MKLPNCYLSFEPNAGHRCHLALRRCFPLLQARKLRSLEKSSFKVFSRGSCSDMVFSYYIFHGFEPEALKKLFFPPPQAGPSIIGAPFSRNSVVGKLVFSSLCSGATFAEVRGPSVNHEIKLYKFKCILDALALRVCAFGARPFSVFVRFWVRFGIVPAGQDPPGATRANLGWCTFFWSLLGGPNLGAELR